MRDSWNPTIIKRGGLLAKFIDKSAQLEMPKDVSVDDLLRAIDLAEGGNWEAAHNLVQQYEDDATAAWIHAVLHKTEGDLGNARYWYRRAGRMERVDDKPGAELAAIRVELSVDK